MRGMKTDSPAPQPVEDVCLEDASLQTMYSKTCSVTQLGKMQVAKEHYRSPDLQRGQVVQVLLPSRGTLPGIEQRRLG